MLHWTVKYQPLVKLLVRSCESHRMDVTVSESGRTRASDLFEPVLPWNAVSIKQED